MKQIIILRTDKPEQRIVLQTDSMYDDGLFTVLTVSGSIDGISHDFKPGTVVDVAGIGDWLTDLYANNAPDFTLKAVAVSNVNEETEIKYTASSADSEDAANSDQAEEGGTE